MKQFLIYLIYQFIFLKQFISKEETSSQKAGPPDLKFTETETACQLENRNNSSQGLPYE